MKIGQICAGFCLCVFAVAACTDAVTTPSEAQSQSLYRLRSAPTVWTDPDTGCEYLVMFENGITPRTEYNNSYASGYAKHRGCR